MQPVLRMKATRCFVILYFQKNNFSKTFKQKQPIVA